MCFDQKHRWYLNASYVQMSHFDPESDCAGGKGSSPRAPHGPLPHPRLPHDCSPACTLYRWGPRQSHLLRGTALSSAAAPLQRARISQAAGPYCPVKMAAIRKPGSPQVTTATQTSLSGTKHTTNLAHTPPRQALLRHPLKFSLGLANSLMSSEYFFLQLKPVT